MVRPTNAADVAAAIRFGRDHDLEIAIRSGAHSNSGHSTTDGGLVIDMSRMRGVTVDPEHRQARANGGALLGELDVAAQAHGLVCPVGVIGHTGVAGLTLGAGTVRSSCLASIGRRPAEHASQPRSPVSRRVESAPSRGPPASSSKQPPSAAAAVADSIGNGGRPRPF